MILTNLPGHFVAVWLQIVNVRVHAYNVPLVHRSVARCAWRARTVNSAAFGPIWGIFCMKSHFVSIVNVVLRNLFHEHAHNEPWVHRSIAQCAGRACSHNSTAFGRVWVTFVCKAVLIFY